MTSLRLRARRSLFAILLSVSAPAGPALLLAQEATDLPAAQDLVDRYVEAIGGRDAVLRPRSYRTRGTFAMPAAGLTAEMEVVSDRSGRVASTMEIPGLGTFRSGYDGDIGWSVDPMMGARILEGAELTALTDQADPLAMVRDASLFRGMRTVERTEIGGQPCYKVRLEWNSGRETHDCYGTDTGLMVASIGTQESPMGSVEATSIFSDFAEFGGVRFATRMVQRMMGQEQVMTIRSVEFDDAGDADFAPPAEIRAIRGG
jgi:hypothetical protein